MCNQHFLRDFVIRERMLKIQIRKQLNIECQAFLSSKIFELELPGPKTPAGYKLRGLGSQSFWSQSSHIYQWPCSFLLILE